MELLVLALLATWFVAALAVGLLVGGAVRLGARVLPSAGDRVPTMGNRGPGDRVSAPQRRQVGLRLVV
jgi:hypothetical protein